MYYKPESLEENFSNVLKLRDNFMNNIKSYMWEYGWICRVYTDANTYNLYLTVNNFYSPLGLIFSDNTEFLSRS